MSNAPAAFEATYSDWKLVKSRKVVQIVLEVPMEKADLAYQVLGGMPDHAAEAWLAVAKLDKTKVQETKQPRRWNELSVAEQAGIRCNEKAFLEFIRDSFQYQVANASEAAWWLRDRFSVESRKDIPRDKWEALDNEYQIWCRA